jgi:hypothetical protein
MKNQIVISLVQITFLAVIATMSGVGSAHGQSPSNGVRVKVPFDFTVADKKFPAGEYSITRAQPSSGDLLLCVSSVQGKRNAFRLTSGVATSAPKDSDTLVFHQYGDQYFLSQVWPAGANVGRMFLESRGEREARERMTTDKMAMDARTVLVPGPQ